MKIYFTSFSDISLSLEGENESARLLSTVRKLLVMVTWRVSEEWTPTSVRGSRFSGHMNPSVSSSSRLGERRAEPRSCLELAWYLMSSDHLLYCVLPVLVRYPANIFDFSLRRFDCFHREDHHNVYSRM